MYTLAVCNMLCYEWLLVKALQLNVRLKSYTAATLKYLVARKVGIGLFSDSITCSNAPVITFYLVQLLYYLLLSPQ